MNSVPWGGSEVLWYEAAELVAKEGHFVTLSTPLWSELPLPLAKAKAEWGAQHSFYPSIQHHHLFYRLARRFTRQSAENLKRTWLRQKSPAMLCISNGNAYQGLDWMEAAMAENVPFVTIAQAHADFLDPIDSRAEMLIKAFSAARINYFVARANQVLVETQLGFRFTNASLIANHTRHLQVTSCIPWPQQPDDTMRLACVGRLHPASKGQDLLFQALSSIHWKERDWQLSLFGAGEQEHCLRRLTALLGISERVHFMGHISDPLEIWKTHHALVLPSRYEGSPLVLMEAMLSGRPVIATAVAGIPELIQHGRTGFMADAPTVENLQRCLDQAWVKRSEWPVIGLAGHAVAAERAREIPAVRLARELVYLAEQV